MLGFLLSNPASAQEEPKRLSGQGRIRHQTFDLPKWNVQPHWKNNVEVGDHLMIFVKVKAGESLTVGAYLQCKKGNKWQPVKPSAKGRQWGYQSVVYQSVGIWGMISNKSANDEFHNVSLFLPQGAIDLPDGNYMMGYKLRILSGGKVLDDLWMTHAWKLEVKNGMWQTMLPCCIGATSFDLQENTPD